VLKGMQPHLKFSVENKLSSDPKAGRLESICTLKASKTFRPPKWPSRLVPSRNCWTCGPGSPTCAGSLQGNDQLDQALFDAVSKTEELNKLRAEMGQGRGGQE
jgi:type VI secretion system protein ImpB